MPQERRSLATEPDAVCACGPATSSAQAGPQNQKSKPHSRIECAATNHKCNQSASYRMKQVKRSSPARVVSIGCRSTVPMRSTRTATNFIVDLLSLLAIIAQQKSSHSLSLPVFVAGSHLNGGTFAAGTSRPPHGHCAALTQLHRRPRTPNMLRF